MQDFEVDRNSAEYKLRERVKELNCFYKISMIVEEMDYSLDDMMHEIVNVFPPSWQYPEFTCARITIGDKVFLTDNYEETDWSQSAEILVSKKKAGTVNVRYLKQFPQEFEGVFLEEERHLINAIAKRLGHVIERKRLQADTLELNKRLRQALIRALGAYLPICASCKDIRDKDGEWVQFERFVTRETGTAFSHSICPTCLEKLYPEIGKKE